MTPALKSLLAFWEHCGPPALKPERVRYRSRQCVHRRFTLSQRWPRHAAVRPRADNVLLAGLNRTLTNF